MPNSYQRVIPVLAAGVVAATAMIAPAAAGAEPSVYTALPGLAAPLPTDSTYCDLGFYCRDDEIGSVLDPYTSSTDRPGFGKATPWVPDY